MKLSAMFGDHAVLQREQRVPVWGWTKPGLRVRVKLGEVGAETLSGADGRFLTWLPPMPAGGPFMMEVNTPDPDERVVCQDILVGEVWLCAGQSNMEWTLGSAVADGAAEIAAANHPKLRTINLPRQALAGRQSDVVAAWQVCDPATAAAFTAVGYHFARVLQQRLEVPVGLINASWGGTRIEAWLSREALVEDAELRLEVEHYEATCHHPAFWATVDPYDITDDAQRQVLQAAGNAPAAPPAGDGRFQSAQGSGSDSGAIAWPILTPLPGPGNPQMPGILFDNMIAPVVPYGLRGALWYQGESNADCASRYGAALARLIRDWRHVWGQGNFAFLTVQLANYTAPLAYQAQSTWALVREGQLQSLELPETGLAVAIDIGEANNIHPRNKRDVGARLAQWALTRTYGLAGVPSGPLFAQATLERRGIRVRFLHTGVGLVAKDGALQTFVIAGEDRKFVPAMAVIEGATVLVSSPQVLRPAAVRYAWADNPEGANLYNAEGLPASPFRSDAW